MLGTHGFNCYFCLMQKLAGYIQDLLIDHECVIIPGFGGFVTSFKPAFYDRVSNKFFPPSKAVSFNSKLTHNDGLLCQQIMKHEHKNFSEATDNVATAVQHARKKLEVESLYFKGIGTLIQNENSILVFEPERENGLLKTSYGLASFQLAELKQEERGRYMQVIKGEPKTATRRSIGSYAAAVAAIVLMFFFLFPARVKDTKLNEANFITSFDSLDKSVLEKSEFQSEFTDAIVSDSKEDVENEVNDRKSIHGETMLDSEPELMAEMVEQNQEQKKDKEKENVRVVSAATYHIIIASLSTRQQALDFVEKNCKKDFPEYSIIESNGRYRVSIGTFTKKSVAIPVLETFRESNPKFKDAWLLTIKATV